MDKKVIIKTITSHRKLAQFCINLYNNFYIKNKLHSKGCTLSTGITLIKGLKIINHGINNKVFIGDFSRINNCTIIIHGDNNIIDIKEYAYLNEIELYMEDSNNEISIGEHTSLCGKAHFAAIEGTKIEIGNNCLFSSGLHFRTGDSHSITDLNGKRINPSQDIIISDHVWIGTKVTCLKGVYVAENSMVGATTTLSCRYEDKNCIIAGVPGRIVKSGVNWDSRRLPMEL